MRDLRPELFVGAYQKTRMIPIKGRWMGYGMDTMEACALASLAISERPDTEETLRGRGMDYIRPVVAEALGMTEADVAHFCEAWDHGIGAVECDGCDVCRAAEAASVEVTVRISRPRSPMVRKPTVRPIL